ncbi:hypothetical protein BH23VER1_BH23VER1_36270 [soil metagenome]
MNLVDLGFMDARAKLIDIAAFLDRIDRAGQGDDFRVGALRAAIGELGGADPGRARRILEALSDPSDEPIERATVQGASGAYQEKNPAS